MQPVDCVVKARWIAPVEPAGVLEHHALVIAGGRIVDCLPAEAARARYAPREELVRADHLVVPGFVNAEVDLAASLWRGVALAAPARATGVTDGSPEPLPAEAIGDSVSLGLAEQLLAGITTALDAGPHPELVATTAAALGQRVVVGLRIGDEEALARALRWHDEYRDHPFVRTAFAADCASLTDAQLTRLRVLADQLERPVLATAGDRGIARLKATGLWTAALALRAAGGVDPGVLAGSGVSVIATPGEDLYLGRPFVPVAVHLAHEVTVALGSGRLPLGRDLLGVLRLAAHLGGGPGPRTDAPPPRPAPAKLLAMATLCGARALGLEESVGSLVPGKRADFVCIDLARPATSPVVDPLVALVELAGRDAVSDVWAGGRALVTDGRLALLDWEDLNARVARHQTALLAGSLRGTRQ